MSERSAEKAVPARRRWRKKPIEIEAVQWGISNHEEIKAFLGSDYLAVLSKHSAKPAHLSIRTLEGQLYAAPGDWIIRGIHGEHYPCKPDIFLATYEPAIPPATPTSKEADRG